MSFAAEAPNNGVPERAFQWISSYLRATTADPGAHARVALVTTHGLDVLQVKDLKKLCHGIHSLTFKHTGNVAADAPAPFRFVKTRSGAPKAELIMHLKRCFFTDPECRVVAPSNDEIWRILDNSTSTSTTQRSSNGSRPAAVPVASAPLLLPTGYRYGVPPPPSPKKKSGTRKSTMPSPTKATRKRKLATTKTTGPNQVDYVDMTLPPSKWGPPKTNGALARAVKIKKEQHAKASSASSFSPGHSIAASASTTVDDDYYSLPKDLREMSLLAQLKAMGFTDQREMLAGLRHVEKERGGGGTIMSLDTSSTHVEEAMMWIVAQREEAEEARKMDLARITSEYEHSEEERRKKDTDQRLQEASIEDIVGMGENSDSGHFHKHKSKFFHFSILLRSELVRSIFLSTFCPDTKKNLIHLLKLEQKANQWYGAVLPWAYFNYVATGRIESWAHDKAESKPSADPPNEMIQNVGDLIRIEAETLERGLYVMSEQHNNGLQNVPKIFTNAREDALEKGLPDGPEGQAAGESDDDDVIIVVENKKVASSPDKKPAAKSTGSSSSSSRNNCSSSSARKQPPKASEAIEIIEIM